MNTLTLNTQYADSFIEPKMLENLKFETISAMKKLLDGSGVGADMRGWIDLPNNIPESLFIECERIATYWKGVLDVVVIIGIGGSYLGSKCALEAFSHSFSSAGIRNVPHIVFAGYSLSEDYMADLLGYLKGKNYGLVVISKSGTTTEPAIAFRILKTNMLERFGEELTRKRIITITSSSNGALNEITKKEGYSTFSVPENVGGRYSVLSAVGLLPIAIAGFDIRSFVKGAQYGREEYLKLDISNPVIRYVALRNALYRMGKKIEVFVNYHPKFKYLGEWLKQLFAESEGKGRKGLFPATLDFTTDLHSVGQYIQDGERIMFETAILAGSKGVVVNVPFVSDNLDGLDYLAGKSLEDINAQAEIGTRMAHVVGEVPNIYIKMDKIEEFSMGQLFYFFEVACATSAYLLGVNPFDQPGVDVYKNNLYKLLGRPGF